MSDKMTSIKRNVTARVVRSYEKRQPPLIDSISDDRKLVSFEPISTAC